MIDVEPDIIEYIVMAPFFWQSMGFTTAIAMFVGAVIYNGDLNQARKGIISVTSYAIMILWVIFSRIFNIYDFSDPTFKPAMAFASIITIAFVSFFWLVGIIFGVFIYKNRKVLNDTVSRIEKCLLKRKCK
jgi:hypothetical protein